jgi:ribosome-associated protein
MAQHVVDKLEGKGLKGIRIEGAVQGDWVLIDGGDIVIHLFRPEVRAFYNLEKMWGLDDAPNPSPAFAPIDGPVVATPR